MLLLRFFLVAAALFELFLELVDDILKFGNGPVLEVIAAFLGLSEVLLKLFRIIILLNDFLEEVLLLFLLVALHI